MTDDTPTRPLAHTNKSLTRSPSLRPKEHGAGISQRAPVEARATATLHLLVLSAGRGHANAHVQQLQNQKMASKEPHWAGIRLQRCTKISAEFVASGARLSAVIIVDLQDDNLVSLPATLQIRTPKTSIPCPVCTPVVVIGWGGKRWIST